MRTLYIPIELPVERSFLPSEGEAYDIFGCIARFHSDGARAYMTVSPILDDRVNDIAAEVLFCIRCSALITKFGALAPDGLPKITDSGTFDGQFTTAHPADADSRAFRGFVSIRVSDPIQRFATAVRLASNAIPSISEDRIIILSVALELFSQCDFEYSVNAKFLTLCMALEVISVPGDRPPSCQRLVDGFIEEIARSTTVENLEERQGLDSLRNAALQLRRQSIRSSIRRTAERCSRYLGVQSPDLVGKNAALLYDKRSKLIHEGADVSSNDLNQIRDLVRNCLIVETGLYHHLPNQILVDLGLKT